MKTILAITALIISLGSCNKSKGGSPVPPPEPPVEEPKDTLVIPTGGYEADTAYEGYHLVWSDEFNQASLLASDWSFENGDGCPNLCGWGNNELEYYTSSNQNLFFRDGNMIVRALKESYGGKSYTSARIKTQSKRTFRFGRIDIRAVMPVGRGIWPAFWLMPQESVHGPWPTSGELDMMEYLGHEPSKIYGTVHFGPGPGSTNISRSTVFDQGRLDQAFHLYSLVWKQDTIQWLLDDKVYSTITKVDLGANTYPFNEDFYFIINLAVGGNWPGSPDQSTVFPQHLIVDYIRFYQQP